MIIVILIIIIKIIIINEEEEKGGGESFYWIWRIREGAPFQSRTICQKNPGRTFLGKRRYFSGIAALTPLTPLTYKQNAVNAFIPTKKRR